MKDRIIYTIGHSTHPIERFIGMLTAQGIRLVVDVRTSAASRFAQYNKKSLSRALEDSGLLYRHQPEAFGARQTDYSLLDPDRRVDFEKVRSTPMFKSALDELLRETTSGVSIALMCAEGDPLDCHRFSMIAPALKEKDFEIKHILPDQTIMTQEALEHRLLQLYEMELSQVDMFQASEQIDPLQKAYRLKNKEIGYVAGIVKRKMGQWTMNNDAMNNGQWTMDNGTRKLVWCVSFIAFFLFICLTKYKVIYA